VSQQQQPPRTGQPPPGGDAPALPEDDADCGDLAEQLASAVRRRGWSVSAAESLTGGQVAGRLSAAPDSAEWFRGGVVAYATEVKQQVLGGPGGASHQRRVRRRDGLGRACPTRV
jgi:hypothetical protein